MSEDAKKNGRDYDVGYGKPPKHSRFKPGQSGHPKGRPKKTKDDFADVVKKVLSEPVQVTENGKAVKMANKEVVVRQMVRRGQAGHHPSVKEIIRLADKHDLNPFKPPEESPEEKAQRKEYSEKLVRMLDEYASMKKRVGSLETKLLEAERKLAEREGREPDPDILTRR